MLATAAGAVDCQVVPFDVSRLPELPGATNCTASLGFWKKKGCSRVGSEPISRAWAA